MIVGLGKILEELEIVNETAKKTEYEKAREPLQRIGKLALKHTPYEYFEAKRHKPLVFSEVSAVHKECMRKAKERNIERIKGGKR